MGNPVTNYSNNNPSIYFMGIALQSHKDHWNMINKHPKKVMEPHTKVSPKTKCF